MLCRVGDVEIWRVLECVTPFMPVLKFFPTLTTDQFSAHRDACGRDGFLQDKNTGEEWLVIPIQSFLLRTSQALILVDACVGNHKTLPNLNFWNDMQSNRFLASLAAADARVEDVTHVLCTHLHVDHVGWTTSLDDGQWVPTFPNAKVLATQVDLDFARSRALAAPDSTSGSVWRQSIEPLIKAQCLETIRSGREVDRSVRLMPTPGHTPGHVSVQIRSAPGERGASITGDLIHSPLQCVLPNLSPVVDFDAEQAARTRRSFLEAAADSRELVLATHFPLPSCGIIGRHGDAFEWRPLDK